MCVIEIQTKSWRRIGFMFVVVVVVVVDGGCDAYLNGEMYAN